MNNTLNQLLAARKHLIETGQYYEGGKSPSGMEPALTKRAARLERALIASIDNLLDAVNEL